MISRYFERVRKKIRDTAIVIDENIDYKEFSSDEGMIRGELLLINGYILEFMEYIEQGTSVKYRFHLMDEDRKMLFRYDNAPHHRVHTFPHHKHLPDKIEDSEKKNFISVLNEIENLILKS
ncbi:hypothetical protein JXI42_09850 [bacterium]|nr:hypothetical protein [bacterium]